MTDPMPAVRSILGMPPEPVDHKAEALRYAAQYESLLPDFEYRIDSFMQMHATLYLGEQQRIANQIAYLNAHPGMPAAVAREQIEKELFS